MRIGGRAAGQKHSGRIVALKPRVIDGYEASSEVPETQKSWPVTTRSVHYLEELFPVVNVLIARAVITPPIAEVLPTQSPENDKMKQYVDETKAVAKEGVAARHSATQRDLSKAGAVLKLFTAEEADADTPFGAVQTHAFAILDRDRLDRVADHLAKTAACDEVALQWAHVDRLAPQFKRHLRPLLQAGDLTAPQPETPLLAAVAFLKRAFAKGQALGQLPEGAIPTRCIPKRLRRYLYEQVGREGRRLRADRYEFWVYRLVRQALEAGDLSCRQSVRFRSFEDELLSDDAWQHKEALIARLGLPVLTQPIAAQLADLEHQLEERLQAVNQRLASGENTHVRITQRGSAVRWTLAHPRAAPAVNHALFDALPPRDIASIVHFVDRRCPFLHHFDHLFPRFAKRRADARVLRACLVAWGINMGLGRMGETSDLGFQALQDTSDNFIRLETLGPANDCIANGIVALPITHHYDLGGLVHSSSDGQKFETRRPTINARHGVKYFGLQKGIVSYSLVANCIRQAECICQIHQPYPGERPHHRRPRA